MEAGRENFENNFSWPTNFCTVVDLALSYKNLEIPVLNKPLAPHSTYDTDGKRET